MKITVVGTGYVGLVTGVCLAELGNQVRCVDVDAEKIKLLNAGGVPIFEPGLKPMIESNLAAGRLSFTNDIESGVAHGDIQFIAVGTPSDANGEADLQYVDLAARSIGQYMNSYKVVVNKSTVPVGSASRVKNIIKRQLRVRELDPGFSVVSNPEFLKEGAAIEDFMRPDRIVLGVDADKAGQKALAMMRELYAPFNRNHERTIATDVRSAEFTKYAANAMLATRISFMNDLANLAEVLGADIESVRQGIGSDPRIGYSFLYAGAGYGGSCFPKDIRALMATARTAGRRLRVLEAVDAVNRDQMRVLADKVFDRFGADLRGMTFAIWGLAFKPNTDDMREAPSRTIIGALVRAGANIVAHDPVAIEEARQALDLDLKDVDGLASQIKFSHDPYEAVRGADALLVITEWKAYRSPNFELTLKSMKTPIVIDGRNLYEPRMMRSMGFDYQGVGTGVSTQAIEA